MHEQTSSSLSTPNVTKKHILFLGIKIFRGSKFKKQTDVSCILTTSVFTCCQFRQLLDKKFNTVLIPICTFHNLKLLQVGLAEPIWMKLLLAQSRMLSDEK